MAPAGRGEGAHSTHEARADRLRFRTVREDRSLPHEHGAPRFSVRNRARVEEAPATPPRFLDGEHTLDDPDDGVVLPPRLAALQHGRRSPGHCAASPALPLHRSAALERFRLEELNRSALLSVDILQRALAALDPLRYSARLGALSEARRVADAKNAPRGEEHDNRSAAHDLVRPTPNALRGGG
jgi:hypothetical protein